MGPRNMKRKKTHEPSCQIGGDGSLPSVKRGVGNGSRKLLSRKGGTADGGHPLPFL